MARKGLLEGVRVADQTTQRAFDAVKKAVEQLATDHDVLSSPVTVLVASGPIPAGASLVAFTGGASQVLTLPPANAQGSNTGAAILLLNTSAVAVTLNPTRGDTLSGGTSLSLAALTALTLVSDGVSKWLVPATGGITDGDKGDITVSVGGTVWRIDADVLARFDAAGSADSVEEQLDDLRRKFRYLLASYVTSFGIIPPGLTTEASIAIAQLRGRA